MEEARNNSIPRIATANDLEAAFGTFRRHQRRPSNLLHCMDEDGNIDAFRYIEYSRQRRIEFLQRADFICKMKSSLRMQQQQQQQLHRSSSLPGMTSLPASTTIQSCKKNDVFAIADTHAGAVSPETTTGAMVFRNAPNPLYMGRFGDNGNLPDAPVTRLLSRSASMPFVSSSFARTNTNRIHSVGAASTGMVPDSTNAVNASFDVQDTPQPERRSLRKEEFEAAEALLFGMGRSSTGSKRPSFETRSDVVKINASSLSSEDDGGNNTDAEVENEDQNKSKNDCVSLKKRRTSDTPPRGTLSRSDEMGSVLSVVSTEEESSSFIKCINV